MSHAGLPVRYIQRSQLSDLYWQMQAEWEVLSTLHPGAGTCPSYKTFCRRYTSTWKSVLVMRKSSQHAQCQTCFDLQQILHSGSIPWEQRVKAARLLREHRKQQYHDRMLYWSLRFASKINSDVLVIIIDDMDHSKFAWSRFGFRKQTHELDNVVRPTVTFTAALAHGFGTYLYMAGPQVAGSSAYFLEVLSQTLEYVYAMPRLAAQQPRQTGRLSGQQTGRLSAQQTGRLATQKTKKTEQAAFLPRLFLLTWLLLQTTP